jgi:hypothetical protein
MNLGQHQEGPPGQQKTLVWVSQNGQGTNRHDRQATSRASHGTWRQDSNTASKTEEALRVPSFNSQQGEELYKAVLQAKL